MPKALPKLCEGLCEGGLHRLVLSHPTRLRLLETIVEGYQRDGNAQALPSARLNSAIASSPETADV